MRCFLFTVLVGCSGPSEPPEPGDAARGKILYETHCVACHQVDGTGQINGGRPMAGSFAGKNSVLLKDDDALLRSISNGTVGSIGSMPPWVGVLSTQERLDVLAYIRKSFGQDPGDGLPEGP